MYYRATLHGGEDELFDICLSGDSEITPAGFLKGQIVKKNGAGDYVKTGRQVIVRDWVMLEIFEEKKEAGF